MTPSLTYRLWERGARAKRKADRKKTGETLAAIDLENGIKSMILQSATLREIGDKFSISAEYARQIGIRLGIDSPRSRVNQRGRALHKTKVNAILTGSTGRRLRQQSWQSCDGSSSMTECLRSLPPPR